jgi:DNA-binding SARP family transcriptional activator/streptogramin lyase
MRFRVLGPLEVWDDGVQSELGGGRQRALLALLVLRRNEVVSIDRIIDGLWGEHPPATAQKVVQGYVSQLRRAVGADALVTHPWGYGLVAPRGRVDVDEFERLVDRARGEGPARAAETLREALELWRGPALVDVAYDEFAQGEIARLEEARLTAVEDRIDAELSLGWAARLIPELEALAREHPLRERLRGQLILALYRTGRQAEALEFYAGFRRRLVDELGIEPGPELKELQRQILAQDPALGPIPRPPLSIVARHRWKLVAAGAALIAAAATAAALWLTHGESAHVAAGPNTVAALDPKTNRLVDAFSVGSVPTQLATGGNAVWVVNSDERTVSRIEPGTRSVRTVSTGTGPTDIAVGSGSAWVTNSDSGMVSRIDLRSAEVRRTIRLPGGRREQLATWIAASPSDVWVSGSSGASRIDPHTNKVTRTVPLDDRPRAVAIVGDSVWVRGDFGIVRLDRRTGRLEHQLALASHGCCERGGLAVGGGSLWTPGIARGVLWRLHAKTGLLVAAIPVRGTPAGVAVGGGAVWVADRPAQILKVNPNTNKVVARIPVNGVPSGLAFGFGRLWIALD